MALDKNIKSELQNQLADKSEDMLTNDEKTFLKNQRENKSKTLNIRFTESEYQNIIDKCEQFGYKKKSEYVRDCVRARISLETQQADFSETNRQIKAIGNNINQIAIRLHSSGNFYAEDMQEIKQKVGELWRLLLSIQSGQQSAVQSDTSLTAIRPSTDYMFRLISAEPVQEEQQRTSHISEKTEQDGQKS
ncbi:MAG: MobC family plasmid mobilization relaxosome protein [Lachnospiraceae bacterium]|nr:MobC family plasmid mobilization relaxosome protein [Lachnospiraceae bacterium]